MNEWKGYALAAALFGGLTAVFAKLGVTGIPSHMATFLRTVVVIAFTAVVLTVQKGWANPAALTPKALVFLVLSGIATGLSWLCYFKALQMGPTSLVAAVDKLSLVVAVLLAVVFLKDSLSLSQWAGVGFMVVGTLLVIH